MEKQEILSWNEDTEMSIRDYLEKLIRGGYTIIEVVPTIYRKSFPYLDSSEDIIIEALIIVRINN